MNNLLEYLYGTLSADNMRWVGEHLIEHAKMEEPLKPYTMEEINAMLDEAEADFAAGKGIPHEESMRRWREKIALKKQELEMVAAV